MSLGGREMKEARSHNGTFREGEERREPGGTEFDFEAKVMCEKNPASPGCIRNIYA